MKFSYFIIFGLVFFLSCKNDSTTTETNPENTNETSSIPISEAPTLVIETTMDEQDTPHSIVSVLVRGNKLKITEVNACEEISKEDYANYQIPDEAIAACGGWWAGAGDYFYMIDNGNDNFTILRGSMDEQQTSDDYGYKMVMNLSNKTK